MSLVFFQHFFSSFVGWFLDLHAKGEYIFIVMGTQKRPRISSININIFFISGQSCFSGSENDIYLETESNSQRMVY
jgi:hypothetical protein